MPGLEIDPERVRTNILFCHVEQAHTAELASLIEAEGVKFYDLGPELGWRFVTGYGVIASDIGHALDLIDSVVRDYRRRSNGIRTPGATHVQQAALASIHLRGQILVFVRTRRHSSENKPRLTNTHFHPSVCRRQGCMDDSSVFAGAGFKPAPQYQRHPHTVIPAKAGINPPAISHLRTNSPIPFSSSVVSVATDIGDCYKNMPSQPVVGATLVVARPRCKRPSPI